jgi:hypothetical protein
MKTVQTIFVMCILIGVLQVTPVKASSCITEIYGYVYDSDTSAPIPYVELVFTNLETAETRYSQTDLNGYYQFDLDDFTNGWSYA